jgi:hypothetical protein
MSTPEPVVAHQTACVASGKLIPLARPCFPRGCESLQSRRTAGCEPLLLSYALVSAPVFREWGGRSGL